MSVSADIQVNVVEGELATFQADVIVNSTNPDLKLGLGRLSKSLLLAAGQELQDECSRSYPTGVDVGEVAVTHGYGLQCKYVYHGALPAWEFADESVDPEQCLCKFVCACLQRAHDDKMTSLALPGLGCGFLGYPPNTSAGTIYQCIAIFQSSCQVTTLKTISIVIFTKGGDWIHTKRAFQRVLTGEVIHEHKAKAKPPAREKRLPGFLAKARKVKHDDAGARPKQVAKPKPVVNTFSQTCIRQTEQNSCRKALRCGHVCGGFKKERVCPPCLEEGCESNAKIGLTKEDDCIICFTDQLAAAPVVMLKCGHVFHLHCAKRILENKWVGARITFNFTLCPLCKQPMEHEELDKLLKPIRDLQEDVRRKAKMRLEYEGQAGSKPLEDAMEQYCYYRCYKCKKAYFGGTMQCEGGDADRDFDPKDLVCGGCSGASRDKSCRQHGDEFISYKCRYCCTVAIYFCFGDTHFCQNCHDRYYQMRGMQKDRLPRCPAGPVGQQLTGKCPLGIKHAATGDEFALGCGLCSNISTF